MPSDNWSVRIGARIVRPPKKYVKRLIPIEAIQYTGDNWQEIAKWMHEYGLPCGRTVDGNIIIHTLEGEMMGRPGDYIIKGIRDEFYPCDREIFEESYEEYVD